MVLIDLQKAFDTVDYTILTTKLNPTGIDDSAGSWFKSYLAGRKQVINGRLSTAGNITCRVPQGSILGPLLFNIYVNDMVTSVNCDIFLYADDSTLLVSGKNPAVIQNTLSIELNAIRGWLEENKLSIHLGKTESILIASKIRLARADRLKISSGSVAIESKSKITYLGLTFDNDMSFSYMGNSVIKKVNAKLKFLYRKSAFFGTNERKLLCSALVNPHFEYACNAWYRSVNAKVKHKLQTAQNKIIRYLLNYGCRRHIGFSDFKKSNCLDINAMVDYRVTWGMAAPGGKTVPPPVDNLKLLRTFTEYTECCYHLPDTCFERSTPRSRRTLKYSIFNIYIFFDVIFPHHYTCHSSLYISDNKESIISCQHMITILITTMVLIERHYVLFPKTAFF